MVTLSILLLGILFIFSVAAGLTNFNLRLLRSLHFLQLEDYDPIRLIKTLKRKLSNIPNLGLELVGAIIVAVALIIIHTTENKIELIWGNLALIIVSGLSTIGFILWSIGVRRDSQLIKVELDTAKKKLVLTDRAKRIKLVAGIIAILVLVIYLVIGLTYYLILYDKLTNPFSSAVAVPFSVIPPYHTLLPDFWNRIGALFIMLAIFLYVPLTFYIFSRLSSTLLTVSVFALTPHEKLTQLLFMGDAQSILKDFNPLVIGITGSYGKTSVKEILAVLLASNYNVLKPPGSYNTLMGVTRLIREQLRHYHDVFIVEMGAYREGSIAKLCKLTKPTHGLITVIGLQHLERFKTQKSIQRAKGELIRSLPTNGIAILNGDDPLSCEIGDNYGGKTVYFSMSGSRPDREVVFVSNIDLSVHSSNFDVNFPDEDSINISLPLLGRAAIVNTVAAIAMADSLGVNRQIMSKALASIPQVRHRLELIRREDGVNIIDDAFNSNPVGAAHALEVLSKGTGGKRILITPGMVELGEKEDVANEEFGKLAAECSDLVILVGDNRIKPIEHGLVSGGFAAENIWIVPSFQVGMEKLEPKLKTGDTILIENDLPDQYDNL